MASQLSDHMQELIAPSIVDLQRALETHDLPRALAVGDELRARCDLDAFLCEHLTKIEG